jgi:hypothetical protein
MRINRLKIDLDRRADLFSAIKVLLGNSSVPHTPEKVVNLFISRGLRREEGRDEVK